MTSSWLTSSADARARSGRIEVEAREGDTLLRKPSLDAMKVVADKADR